MSRFERKMSSRFPKKNSIYLTTTTRIQQIQQQKEQQEM